MAKPYNEEYTNKNWELTVARKFPKDCPKCKHGHNLIKQLYNTPGLCHSVIVICPKCKWEKDITPYELI